MVVVDTKELLITNSSRHIHSSLFEAVFYGTSYWYVCLEVTLCFHCSLVWCILKSLWYTLKAFGCLSEYFNLSEYFIVCLLYPGCHLYLNIVSMSVISLE
jgi:hypothetical protein